MRLGKDLVGMELIGIDSGARLGKVKDLYLDKGLNSITGLFLGQEGLISRKFRFVPRSELQLLGRDYILVVRTSAVLEAGTARQVERWLRRDRLQGRLLATAGGTRVGHIGDVLLNDDGTIGGFALTNIMVKGPIADKKVVLRDAILELGSDEAAMTIDLARAERQDVSASK